MGNSCSHSKIKILEVQPKEYIDTTKTWRFITADCVCVDCNTSGRAIRKKCIDHNIKQPWQFMEPSACTHESLEIKNIEKDDLNKCFRGRSSCVVCLASVPAKMEYSEIVDKNTNKTIYVKKSDWNTDRKLYLLELETKRKNKENKIASNKK